MACECAICGEVKPGATVINYRGEAVHMGCRDSFEAELATEIDAENFMDEGDLEAAGWFDDCDEDYESSDDVYGDGFADAWHSQYDE
jgi:hypothetical protein